ncbi:MAG: hypothetical protein LBF68_05970 [Christensenellaceae bacterium]|nr:hypothetical protein [Christensenellaceae bacterium]
MIVEKHGGAERVDYGDGLITGLANELTSEYRKGFDKSNLRNTQQFF